MAATLTHTYNFIASSSSGIASPSLFFTSSERTDFEKTCALFYVAPPWVNFVLPVDKEWSTSQILETRLAEETGGFVPRTEFGKRLVAMRIKAIAAGMRLLSEDKILEEVNRRRGELEEHDTDLS